MTERSPLETTRIIEGGVEVDFGSINPRRSKKKRLWIRIDGRLELEADRFDELELIDGYVTPVFGSNQIVTINTDGSISVEEAEDPTFFGGAEPMISDSELEDLRNQVKKSADPPQADSNSVSQ